MDRSRVSLPLASLLLLATAFLAGCVIEETPSPTAPAPTQAPSVPAESPTPAHETPTAAPSTSTPPATETATETATATQTPTFTATATEPPAVSVCPENPAPPDPDRQPIEVDLPEDAAQSSSPLMFSGEASVNEARWRARLIGARGRVLAGIPVWATSTTETYLEYEWSIGFDVAEPTPACFETYQLTQAGEPRDIVQREVTLLPEPRSAGRVCPLNETPPRSSTDPDIVVGSPMDFDEVGLPFDVSGGARVFEANVLVRVLAPDGEELYSGFTTATAGAPEFARYDTSINFALERATPACLQVFSRSPRDGAIENLVQRELLIRP